MVEVKINQITRYLTIAVAAVQGIAYIVQLKSSKADALYAMQQGAPISIATFTFISGCYT
jgi:preprotein translocase subunit SecY